MKDVAGTPGGRLFVLRRAPGMEPNERIDVFDPDGACAGTLPPGFPLPRVRRSGDEFIRVEADELQHPTLVVHRIERD